MENVSATELNSKPIVLDSSRETADNISIIKNHIEIIRTQLEIITKELAVHDLQAQNDMGVLMTDITFLKGNVEKTQICLTDVNEVLDKLAVISNSNTRSIGAAAETIKDLGVILSANADKREMFYQDQISAKHEAEIKLEADRIKARDKRTLKWIAIIGGILGVCGTIVIILAEHYFG